MNKFKLPDAFHSSESSNSRNNSLVVMCDDFAGLSAMMWMKTHPDHVDGLKVYSLLYRKPMGDDGGEYLYTVMADDVDTPNSSDPRRPNEYSAGTGRALGVRDKESSKGMDVRLEGIVGKKDPLKGMFTAQLKVSFDRKIEAIVIGNTCLVKSW